MSFDFLVADVPVLWPVDIDATRSWHYALGNAFHMSSEVSVHNRDFIPSLMVQDAQLFLSYLTLISSMLY